MARFGLLSRLVLILLGSLVLYGAVTLVLLRWEATHHTRPAPFLRVKQFAADIDLFAAAPSALWPTILRTLGNTDIRVAIEDGPPPLDGFIPAPLLQARLRRFARDPASATALVYTSAGQLGRDPRDQVEGFMALAMFPLPDGRTLVARPALEPAGRAVMFGLPLGLWIGLGGAVLAAVAVGMAVRELRPLRALTRSVERFDGRQTLALDPAADGAPDVRALAAAIAVMQQRIGTLLRDRTLMVGAISHDLRTYLTRLQLRVMSLPDGDVGARCVSDLDAMGALIADALAYARGSDVALQRQCIDLADVAATEIAEREAIGTPMPIKADLADASVTGDRVALRRVIANLLDNALRFGRSLVRVTVALIGQHIHLTVEDDGPGVPPTYRVSVLQPFYRVEESRNSRTGGAGLGLAIAAQIVEAHGGTISIDQSPLGGARIQIRLPRASAEGGYD